MRVTLMPSSVERGAAYLKSAEAQFSPTRLFCTLFLFIGPENTLQRQDLAMELCRCDSARPAPEPQRGSTKIAQGKGAKRLPPWDRHPKNIPPLFLFCRPYGRGKKGKGDSSCACGRTPPVFCSRVLCITL